MYKYYNYLLLNYYVMYKYYNENVYNDCTTMSRMVIIILVPVHDVII
jgi:hypothetical protein